MNRSQGINRLQLDNKRAINQEIKTCLPYGLSLVLNRDRNLTHKGTPRNVNSTASASSYTDSR